MIEKIKLLSLVICLLVCAFTMLDLISPNNKFKRELRMVFGMILIVSIITPIIKGDLVIEIPAFDDFKKNDEYLELENTTDKIFLDNFKSNISEYVINRLSGINVNAEKVEVEINITNQTSISISKILVSLDGLYKSKETEITKLIISEFGNIGCEYVYLEEKT